jgi:hypothetical protein
MLNEIWWLYRIQNPERAAGAWVQRSTICKFRKDIQTAELNNFDIHKRYSLGRTPRRLTSRADEERREVGGRRLSTASSLHGSS